MSRSYNAEVMIEKFKKSRKKAIIEAANAEWDFSEEWDEHMGVLSASGDGSLGGGETDNEFADRLNAVIQEANKGKCQVEVRMTYLEDLPCNSYFYEK